MPCPSASDIDISTFFLDHVACAAFPSGLLQAHPGPVLALEPHQLLVLVHLQRADGQSTYVRISTHNPVCCVRIYTLHAVNDGYSFNVYLAVPVY